MCVNEFMFNVSLTSTYVIYEGTKKLLLFLVRQCKPNLMVEDVKFNKNGRI